MGTKHLGTVSYIIWGVVVVMGLGVTFEGFTIATSGLKLSGTDLGFSVTSLGFAFVAVGLTIVAFAYAEISGTRRFQRINRIPK